MSIELLIDNQEERIMAALQRGKEKIYIISPFLSLEPVEELNKILTKEIANALWLQGLFIRIFVAKQAILRLSNL